MDSRLHLVFWRKVSQGTTWGGSEFRLLSYLTALDTSQVRSTVVATHDIFSETFRTHGLDVAVVETGDLHAMTRLERVRRIVRLLRGIRPGKLVLVQGSFIDYDTWDLIAMLAGVGLDRSRFYDLHVSSPEGPPKVSSRRSFYGLVPVGALGGKLRLLSFSLRGRIPGVVFVVSNGAKERIVSWFGYPNQRVRVIHHGIPRDAFSPDCEARDRMRSSLGIPADATVIVSTARFSVEKNPDWVEATIEQFSENHRVWWLLVGDGPLRSEVEARIRQSPASSRVIFVGHVDSARDFLRASNIFVLPSSREGLSNAMLEAMASGLITVVTRVAGADDAITNGLNGFVVEVSKSGLVVGVASALALSETERQAMRREAILTVRDRFDRGKGIERMFNALGLS